MNFAEWYAKRKGNNRAKRKIQVLIKVSMEKGLPELPPDLSEISIKERD
jgi:hypothetical protein